MSSIIEIAKLCGFSPITVSRALDPQKSIKVKASTREKIRVICAEKNFYPRFSARSLASGVTRCVGLIIPGIGSITNSPQGGRYLETFNATLVNAGYSLLLMPVGGEDWDTVRHNAEQLIMSNRCDSYVTLAFSVNLPATAPVTVMKTTASGEISDKVFPVVEISNRSAMVAMVRHLCSEGYRYPLFVNISSAGDLRAEEWRRAVCEVGTMRPPEILRLQGCRFRHGCDPEMLNVMAGYLERMMHFDVWIFVNDIYAMLAGELLRLHGKMPGRDVALVGFDDIENGRPGSRLSTIRPPLEEFGRATAEMALGRIDKKTPFSGVRLLMDSQALFRESTSKEKV